MHDKGVPSMIAQKIENPGHFMKCLLIKDTFDRFLVSDVTVTTFASFHIDGQYHPEFYSGEDVTPQEAENIPDGNQIEWKSVRPFVFSIIRGRRLPLSFHIVLQYSADDTQTLLDDNGLSESPENIYGLFLNLQYRDQVLTVTTGSSLKSFETGHAIDQAWDRRVQEFLTLEDIL